MVYMLHAVSHYQSILLDFRSREQIKYYKFPLMIKIYTHMLLVFLGAQHSCQIDRYKDCVQSRDM